VDLPQGKSGRTADEIARAAVGEASAIALERFRAIEAGNPITREVKGRGNYVTETDLACEAAVMAALREEYPDIPVLSEETAAEVEGWDKGWLWVLDPIDGTSNFARGNPAFAVNLALCHDGEPVLGLTHQPVTGAEFFAVQGRGLTMNGVPTQVGAAEKLSEAQMAFGLGYKYDRAGLMLQLLADLWPGVQMMQNIGTAALGLAYAASGRFDVYLHSYLFPWDMAAGICLIREGGGLVLDRAGEPVSIYSEGLVGGCPGPVHDLVELTRDRKWR
jgi:myo-inositol-1(or 4)-monophosphatase